MTARADPPADTTDGPRTALAQVRATGRVVLAWLRWLSELGVHDYDATTRSRLKILNMIAYLIAITTAIYGIQHTILDYERHAPLIWVNAMLAVVALTVPFSHWISPIAGGLIIVGAEWIALTIICALVGHNSGVQLQYFVGCAAPFVVFGLERLRLVLAVVVSGTILNIVCWFNFPQDAALLDTDPGFADGIYTQAAVTTGALIAASVWYAFSLAEQAKAETERVLRNILPDPIVERLKADPDGTIADSYAHTAVLFADISGFVALSKRLGPDGVVDLLNDLVRAFDRAADAHGIEKIKTIGDAYMAVAGVPEPVADPELRLARFACAMGDIVDETAQRRGLDLKVRIGLASGPLMAGVIGTRKFSYDVWGDTVNLAARLENKSLPGRVLVCPGCALALNAHFTLDSHGTIDIKGLGPQPTWFIASGLTPSGHHQDQTAV